MAAAYAAHPERFIRALLAEVEVDGATTAEVRYLRHV